MNTKITPHHLPTLWNSALWWLNNRLSIGYNTYHTTDHSALSWPIEFLQNCLLALSGEKNSAEWKARKICPAVTQLVARGKLYYLLSMSFCLEHKKLTFGFVWKMKEDFQLTIISLGARTISLKGFSNSSKPMHRNTVVRCNRISGRAFSVSPWVSRQKIDVWVCMMDEGRLSTYYHFTRRKNNLP